jgi:hypothetical protein
MTVSDPPAHLLAGARPVRAAALGRAAAALALVTVVVHALVLDPGSLASLVMAGAAVACLPCAWHLWRRPTAAVWAMTAAVDGAMLLLHTQMLATAGGHAMPMHHGTRIGGLMWLGLGLVLAQLCLAGVAALRRQDAVRNDLFTP